MASEKKITSSAIWLRLPELPIEFYDIQILQKLGNKIGKLLTVDACTSTTTRGRYTRLCVEVPLDQPLKTHLFIGSHNQTIIYEGLNMLCVNCGRLGHQRACSYKPPPNSPTDFIPLKQSLTQNHTDSPSLNSPTPTNDEWKLVQFPRKSMTNTTATKSNFNQPTIVSPSSASPSS
ncbi:PREDICTED: uncharacterized protein LOC109222608, partial [Nicotiana attenuata]|uniref:uncharacterized protein LOC109222608 n=1 Tax=Nicotiana attenuata TaxID=49451 RepID=UPI000904BB73